MGSLCLSSAPILRCESFTRIENIVLIIPTGLEIIFSTSLIFTNWGTGWKHLLLTAEGWTYLALALLDLLTHIVPAVRDDLSLFKTLDIVLASLSFAPIFFYTLFLLLLMRGELVDILPQRYRNVAIIMLLIFIPIIVALEEVSSFVGITHRIARQNDGLSFLAIGFSKNGDRTLWTFFTSLTLALLTAYQAVNFSFAFFRVGKAFIDQRSIEASSSDEAHLFMGIGWIAGGYKLGAIETVIGFAQNGGFGVALTRRILRFLSRAFLAIGIAKGVDMIVDFREIKDELTANKRNRFSRRISRRIISNPRHSTFRQLSPTAEEFHAAPAPPQLPGAPPSLQPRQPRQPGGLLGMSEFAQVKNDAIFRRGERVAVEFDATSGRPPTLHMRFSVLSIPDAAIAAEFAHLKSEIKSAPNDVPRPSSFYANSTMTRLTEEPSSVVGTVGYSSNRNGNGNKDVVAEPEPARIHNAFATMPVSQHGHTRHASQMSGYADSVNSLTHSVVNRLAAQFPGLPPRVTNMTQYRQTLYEQELERVREKEEEEEAELARNSSGKSRKSGTSGLSTSNSFKRKPAPRASAYLDDLAMVSGGVNAANPTAAAPSTVNPIPIDPFDDTEDLPLSFPTPGLLANPDNAKSPHRRTLTGDSHSTTPFSSAAGTDYNFARPTTPGSYAQSSSFTTPNSENPFKYDELQQVQDNSRRTPFLRRQTNRHSRLGSKNLSVGQSELTAVREDQDYVPGDDIESQRNSAYHSRGKSMETIDISWLRRPDQEDASPGSSAYEEAIFQQAVRGKISTPSSVKTPSSLIASRSTPELSRIKSVGNAPRRYTPAPIRTNYTRGSIYIEPIVIPPRGEAFAEVELLQGSAISSMRGGPLRDSDVLGPDDRAYIQAL
ncbi:hypothetical protein D9758_010924 [Tetrapyrgos nigripes]|uniref:Uncharacterized protein n=1 Tax=Tetrapyrgos nigripes TaxID=182062 RepID=A0A8H5FTN6_9AGAR|nr:hypothetical protein D9758_010924 [Tetrapyrgos nigripes]